MNNQRLENRLARVEDHLNVGQCHVCGGQGATYAIVCVPEGADPDDPQYGPEACPACGKGPRSVMRIIGMTEDELP